MCLQRLIVILICCLGCSTTAVADEGVYTLYLVRHAEKQPHAGQDPPLTQAGTQRSQQLADWLFDKGIMDIWSSDYKRTRDTAEPLRAAFGLELNLYNPRNLDALAGTLLDRRNSALVVGHSNTTAELASMICHCSVAEINESDYDQLIEITVDGKNIRLKTLQQSLLYQMRDG